MKAAKLSVDFLKQINGQISKSNGFDNFLKNLKITAGDGGRCQAELLIGKEHINLHGGLHGGLTATLFENLTTYALMTKSYRPLKTIDMQIMYLKAATEGDTLIIDANMTRVDHSNLAHLECKLRRKGDGALIAQGDQVKHFDYRMTHVMLGTTKRGVEFAKQITELLKVAKGFERCMEKVQVIDGGNGKCSAEFVVTPEHLNHAGVLHAGFSTTVMDMITTYALMTKPCSAGVSVNLNVKFLTTAKIGDAIVINAETIRAGKSLAFIDCEMRDKLNGSIIARGNQTKFVDFGKKPASGS